MFRLAISLLNDGYCDTCQSNSTVQSSYWLPVLVSYLQRVSRAMVGSLCNDDSAGEVSRMHGVSQRPLYYAHEVFEQVA